MQLIKRSKKNQVVIPKTILEQAGVDREDPYLKIEYDRRLGAILLRPVSIEEKIPEEVLERFEAEVVKGQPGDRRFPTMDDALAYLRHTRKRRR